MQEKQPKDFQPDNKTKSMVFATGCSLVMLLMVGSFVALSIHIYQDMQENKWGFFGEKTSRSSKKYSKSSDYKTQSKPRFSVSVDPKTVKPTPSFPGVKLSPPKPSIPLEIDPIQPPIDLNAWSIQKARFAHSIRDKVSQQSLLPQRLSIMKGSQNWAGQIGFGSEKYQIIIKEADQNGKTLFIDTDQNGIFEDNRSFYLKARNMQTKPQQMMAMYSGNFFLPLVNPQGSVVSITFFWLESPNSRSIAMVYFADYGGIGTVTVGETKYQAALVDRDCQGDFSKGTAEHPILVYIDLNSNGRFETSEMFDTSKVVHIKEQPFRISVSADGSKIEFLKTM